jgi:hypothetical protein
MEGQETAAKRTRTVGAAEPDVTFSALIRFEMTATGPGVSPAPLAPEREEE